VLLPTDAFAHVPHLLGKIIEPKQSTFGITRAKYDEWDRAARAAGQPEKWRRSHEDRVAALARTGLDTRTAIICLIS
jgi:hypothetical protein